VLHRGQKEALQEFLPLAHDNWITCGNALRLDWLSICPPTGSVVKHRSDDLLHTVLDQPEIDFENEGGETYICGNPPYKGATEQDRDKKADMFSVFDATFDTWKSFDYILGFFQKARLYLDRCDASAAFVTTNSVCQGEQVFRFWPSCLSGGVRIGFAVTSFRWRNLASKNAGVTVCIVGITRKTGLARHYDGEAGTVRDVENINAYLIPYKDIYVKNESKPTNGLAPVVNGSKPADGGGLIFGVDVASTLKAAAPDFAHVVRPFFGAHDGTHGTARNCIWASDTDYEQLRDIPSYRHRFEIVQTARAKSEKKLTKDGVDSPHRFQQVRQRGDEVLFLVPRHSSETREYYPVIALPLGSIVGDGAFSFYDAPLWNIAIFASRVSLVWISAVCGKIKTDFRFSNTLGWNTLPLPALTEKNRADLTNCAEDILLAREAHFPKTIADLYDPDSMPDDLRAAHDRNDEVLERIYIGRRFRNDTERLEKLFDLYTKMTANQQPPGKAKRARA
jgi:hypothetical protein